MTVSIETVAATAPTKAEAQDEADRLAREAEASGLSARYGVLRLREVDEILRPRTVNPWVVLEHRVEPLTDPLGRT